MKTLVRLLAMVLAMFSVPLYAVTIYKCVDASGGITYSQEPCEEEAASETVTIDVTPAENTGALVQQIRTMDLKTDTSVCRRKIREIDIRIERLEKKRDATIERLMAERVDSYEAKVLFDEYRNIDQQIYQLNSECEEKVGKLQEEKAGFEARLADLEAQASDLSE